jgi:hypothetical protein
MHFARTGGVNLPWSKYFRVWHAACISSFRVGRLGSGASFEKRDWSESGYRRGDIPTGARRDKSPGDLVSQGIGGAMVHADPFLR